MSTSSSSSRRRLRLGYAIIPTPQSPPQAAASANLLRQSDSDLAGAGPGGVRDGGVVADTETEPDTDAGAEVEMTDIDWQLQLQLARRPLRRGASGAQQQQQPQQLLRRDRAWNRDRDRDSEDSALRRASSLPMLLLARAHSAAARRSVADIKGQQLAPQSTASLKHPSIPPAPNTLSSHDFDPSAIPVIDDATAQCVLAAYSNDIAHLRRYKTVLLLDSTLDCNIDSVVDAMRNNESFLAEEGDDNDVDNVDEQRVVPLEALSVPLERRAKRIVLNLCSRHLAYLSPNIGFYSSQISQLEICCNSLAILPPEIGHLRHLQFLSVSRNKLRTLPETIALCTKLAHIDAADNLISFLPRSLGSLTMLHTLNLARNRLILLPQEIGAAKSLQRIDVAENTDLQWFPVELFRLKGLVSVDVTGCTSLFGEGDYQQLISEQLNTDPDSPPTLKEMAARVLRRHNAPVYKHMQTHLRAFLDPSNFLTCSFCSGPVFSSANTTDGYCFVRWRRVVRDTNIVFVAREVLCWRHWDTDAERIQRMFDVAASTAPVVHCDYDLSSRKIRSISSRGSARSLLFGVPTTRQQLSRRRSSVILGDAASPEVTKRRLSLSFDELVRGIGDRLRSFSERRSSLAGAPSSITDATHGTISSSERFRSQSNPILHRDGLQRLHARQLSHTSTMSTATTVTATSTSSAQPRRARSVFSMLTALPAQRRHGGIIARDDEIDCNEDESDNDSADPRLQVPVYALMHVAIMLPPLVDRQAVTFAATLHNRPRDPAPAAKIAAPAVAVTHPLHISPPAGHF